MRRVSFVASQRAKSPQRLGSNRGVGTRHGQWRLPYRLIVSHSHSCGPAPAPVFTVLGAPLDMPIIPWPITGRCVMPKALVSPKLPWLLMPPRNPLDELTDGAASLEPVESWGLSMSMLLGSLGATLLLLRR